jgi:hypothetical protein
MSLHEMEAMEVMRVEGEGANVQDWGRKKKQFNATIRDRDAPWRDRWNHSHDAGRHAASLLFTDRLTASFEPRV